MSDKNRRPSLCDFLPSRVTGVVRPPVPGARQTAIPTLLFQMERSQRLPEMALRLGVRSGEFIKVRT